MQNNKISKAVSIGLFSILFSTTTIANQLPSDQAQAEAGTSAVPSRIDSGIDSSKDNGVERISVTATKTVEPVSESSNSLFVVSQDLIDSINAQHIQQLLAVTPGTWISRGNGQEHLTAIRSPVLTGPGSCGAFFVGLDGISTRATGFCNANQLFDINSEQAQQIDVLRGPASTFYGSNALHGVINVITPSANAVDSSLQLDIGAYDFARVKADLSGNLKDTSVRLLSNLTHEGGFQDESGYDQQKVTLITETELSGWRNKTVLDMSNLNQETAGFVQGFEVYNDEDARRENPNPEAFRDAKSVRFYSQFESDNGVTITPYARWNQMTFLQHFLPWKGLEENGHRSLGVQTQYVFEQDNINWLFGIDADLTKGWLKESQAEPFSPSIPQGQHYDYEVDAQQAAAYAQADIELGNWYVIAGIRAEYLRYDYDNLLSDGSACAPDVEVCRFSRPADQDVSFSHLAPSFTFGYELTNDSRIYTKLSRGFRAPQATELFRLQNNQLITDFDEVSMDSVEVGYRLSSSSVDWHLSAYDMQKSDVIVQDTQRQFVPGGDTSHRGIESSLEWRINDDWSLQKAVTWQQHEYDNELPIARTSIRDNQIDTSPEWIGNLALNWQTTDQIAQTIRVNYLDEYFLDPGNSATYKGHTLVDYTFAMNVNEAWSLQVNVYNVLDEDYAERADFAFGNYRYFVGQPRRLFISSRYRF